MQRNVWKWEGFTNNEQRISLNCPTKSNVFAENVCQALRKKVPQWVLFRRWAEHHSSSDVLRRSSQTVTNSSALSRLTYIPISYSPNFMEVVFFRYLGLWVHKKQHNTTIYIEFFDYKTILKSRAQVLWNRVGYQQNFPRY